MVLEANASVNMSAIDYISGFHPALGIINSGRRLLGIDLDLGTVTIGGSVGIGAEARVGGNLGGSGIGGGWKFGVLVTKGISVGWKPPK